MIHDIPLAAYLDLVDEYDETLEHNSYPAINISWNLLHLKPGAGDLGLVIYGVDIAKYNTILFK